MTPASFYALVGTVFGYSDDYDGYHHGQDFPWGGGTSIPSWTAGTVVSKGTNSAIGNYVVIDRGTRVPSSERYAGFCHMQAPSTLPFGAAVAFGDTLGYVGTTGNSTGNHLHATTSSAVYPGTGPWVDPLPIIRAAINGSSTAGGNSKPFPTPAEKKRKAERMLINIWNTNPKTVAYRGATVGETTIEVQKVPTVLKAKARAERLYSYALEVTQEEFDGYVNDVNERRRQVGLPSITWPTA